MSEVIKDQDVEEVSLSVKLPRGLAGGVSESIEEGVAKAVHILVNSDYQRLVESADKLAQLIVGNVHPSTTLVEDRMARMATIKRILEDGDWLTVEDINRLQPKPQKNPSQFASDWKRRGRVFCVNYGGKDYYARYLFDALYQPLPIIKELLTAYGPYSDPWALAAWFHFPNGWITGDDGAPLAPKDALDRREDVLNAARHRVGSYVA